MPTLCFNAICGLLFNGLILGCFMPTSLAYTLLTQSKSKTIITRSLLTISLIVFTYQLQGHVHTFYSKWIQLI